MLHCTALCCALLYCAVLSCVVLCYTVLYCTVLYCTVLYCTVLYCTVLYCTVLYCTVLYCTVLYCTVLYCTVLYCTVLYCTFPVSRGLSRRGKVRREERDLCRLPTSCLMKPPTKFLVETYRFSKLVSFQVLCAFLVRLYADNYRAHGRLWRVSKFLTFIAP